jgi:aspartate/methionine/tyrosine aminotransferase
MWEPTKNMSSIGPSQIREVAKKANPDTIRFDIGEPDFRPPHYVEDAIVQAIRDGKKKYSPAGGLPELRKLIAEFYSPRFEKNITPSQVVITCGAEEALYSAASSYINPGDRVLHPDPGFPNYLDIIRKVGGIPIPINHKDKEWFSLSPTELKKTVKKHKPKMAILNYPNNPTGVTECEMILKDTLKIFDENDIKVVSDEVYERFTYDKEHVSVGKLSDNAIVVNSFSKTYAMTGFRLGYAIAPSEKVAETLCRTQNIIIACPTTPTQYGAIEIFKNPDKSESFVNDIVDEFRKRRDFIVKELNSVKGIECECPDGAFYVFPDIKGTGMSSQELSDFLIKEANVSTVPGSAFGKNGECHLRLAYVNSINKIKEGTDKIKITLDSRS